MTYPRSLSLAAGHFDTYFTLVFPMAMGLSYHAPSPKETIRQFYEV